jgi:hypothetical protein
MIEASEKVATEKQSNGFKRGNGGLYIESRQVKAMLKESTNILFAGERWGATGKGPKSFMAERVFVNPAIVCLDRAEPDGIELVIGHVSGPKGPQSTITYVEYAIEPTLEFEVWVTKNQVTVKGSKAKPGEEESPDKATAGQESLTAKQWALIWTHAQENGLGALRSQGYGRFDVLAWDLLP